MDDWRSQPITASEVLVDGWLQRLECATASDGYKAFRAVSDVCYSFYKNSAKFMWEDKFRKKYIGDIEPPRFEITINKAREYIDIYGPYLFWDYPNRKVASYDPIQLRPELYGDPNDPAVQQHVAMVEMRQSIEAVRRETRCALMERYLNYSQREQQGGLTTHAADAVRDALIKGRGVLVPRTYQRPGSNRTLTGLFYESVDNLRIDPDCCDPHLNSATWVAIRHQETVREVERRFKLHRGALKDAGNLSSHEQIAGLNGRFTDPQHAAVGKSNDIIVWYEIWSKCGVGGWKDGRSDSDLIRALDDVVGDHAYLCVSANVPWLLNAPPEAFHDETTDEEVQQRLAWPFPSHADSRWPMCFLDFYRDSNSGWPIAPLSAALGELICMNVLSAAFVEQAYENRKSIIALLDEAAKDFEAAISGNANPTVVKLKGEIEKSVSDMISFIDRPAMNKDILAALDYVSALFDKRTGLVDFMYGTQQTQDRSARTTAAKEEKTGIRPERMSRDVAAWQTEAATLEKLLACLMVQGSDIRELLGSDDAAAMWDELIYNEDPEVVMHEMKCMVEATDLRRPNRERDMQNLQTLAQQAVPAFMEYAGQSGNWEPLNGFHKAMFKAMEVPFTGMELERFEPQPDPAAEAKAQAEQQKMDMLQAKLKGDMAKTQADVEAKQVGAQLDAQSKQADIESKLMLAELKARESQQKLMFDAASHEQELEQDQQRHSLDMRQQQATAVQGLLMNRAQGEEKIRSQREVSKAKASMAKQKPKATAKK